jgi:hypothetical protein
MTELMNSSITLRKDTLLKYKNPCFLETGTFKGGGVQLALDCGFEMVQSIEIDPTLHELVSKKYESYDNVFIFLGDSTRIMPSILSYIKKPITFWLDAHIQESSVVGSHAVPLIQELELLRTMRVGMQDTVLIDDRRLFGKGTYWHGIKEDDILNLLKQAYPHNKILFEDSNAASQDIVVSVYSPEDVDQYIEDCRDRTANM